MRRTERLPKLIQTLRGRRLTTAAQLADKFGVSLRSIYRDVAELQLQGVPVEGEAGVGYRLGADYDLPPLTFSDSEARALVAAVRLAQTRIDPALATQAEEALSKILAVLTVEARAAAESLAVYAPDFGLDASVRSRLEVLRGAIESRHLLVLHYEDAKGDSSKRVVRPLGCFYWGQVWTLGAWCETRGDFRSFRVDRMREVLVQDTRFRDEVGKTLADFLRQATSR